LTQNLALLEGVVRFTGIIRLAFWDYRV